MSDAIPTAKPPKEVVALQRKLALSERRRADLEHIRDKHQSVLLASNQELAELHRTLERRNAELDAALKRLQEAQQELVMKEKMAALGELIAGIAHELNNPVGALTAAADVSRRCVDQLSEGSALEAKAQRRLEILMRQIQVIEAASARVAEAVSRLRKFVMLDEAERKALDVNDALENCVALLEHDAAGRVRIELVLEPLPEIWCEARRLNQVFYGLVKNAVQAIEGRGRIELRTRRRGEEIEVVIADDGRGIRPEDLERVFEIGFTTQRGRMVSGLGLPTSQRVMRAHGGSISIESEPGAGTTCTLRLPLEPPLSPDRAGGAT